LNVPIPHGAHAFPFSPVYPGLHWQDVITVLPGIEVVLSGQNEHASEPVVVLNWPGAHGAHAAPSAPVKPVVHVQLLMSVAPNNEDEPAGQASHASFRVNVPEGHTAQVCSVSSPALRLSTA